MTNPSEVMLNARVSELGLPAPLEQKLVESKIETIMRLFAVLNQYRLNGKPPAEGISFQDTSLLYECLQQWLYKNGLGHIAKGITLPKQSGTKTDQISKQVPPSKATQTDVLVRSQCSSAALVPPKVLSPKIVNETPSRVSEPLSTCSMQHGPEPSLPSGTSTLPSSDLASRNSELDRFEAVYAPLLKQVELISEIGFIQEEIAEMGKALMELFRRVNLRAALEAVENKYPATFAVFLVGQGVYGYQGGDYWSGVSRALGKEANAFLGQIFVRILYRFRLPVFSELQEKSARFVSQILAHGGIPVYCLGDYFGNIVAPTIKRAEFEGLAETDLIEEILARSASQHATDKPVVHFLEYGGLRAIDFFQRSRQMALAWLEQQSLDEQTLGLPHHIVEFFQAWAPSHLILQSRAEKRLRRPELRLDPWGYGVYLELPAQPVSSVRNVEAGWHLQYDDLVKEDISVILSRAGREPETEEVRLPLERDFERLQVVFLSEDKNTEWVIEGNSAKNPVLAFDPERGGLYRQIPAKIVWLLYPRNQTLEIAAGQGQALEELPRLPGPWRRYRGICWDLTQAEKLILKSSDGSEQQIAIRRIEEVRRPTLINDTQVPGLVAGEIPVFTGRPPTLNFPIASETGNRPEELSRWRVRLYSSQEANPRLDTSWTLVEQSGLIQWTSGEAKLDLAELAMLGSHPAGEYHLEIRGPLGRDANLSFRILPEFRVEGLELPIFMETHRDDPVIRFTVSTSLLGRVEVRDPGASIQVLSPGRYEVQVTGDQSEICIFVIVEQRGSAGVRVPLRLEIPRMRWQLLTDRLAGGSWSTHPVSLSVPAFLQSEHPLLLLELPGEAARQAKLEMRLVDLAGRILQIIMAPSHNSRYAQAYWRFELDALVDTLSLSDAALLRLELVYSNPEIQPSPRLLLIASFTRTVEIRNLQVNWVENLSRVTLSLSWKETRPLHSRVLFIWSLWQPWKPVVQERIPDSTGTSFIFEAPASLMPPGCYLLGITIADPWSMEGPPQEPPKTGENLARLEMLTPERRLEQIESVPEARRGFELTLEAAVISQEIGERGRSERLLAWCCRNLNLGRFQELLVLERLVRQSQVPELHKKFAKWLSDPKTIQRLLIVSSSSRKEAPKLIELVERATSPEDWPAETCRVLSSVKEPHLSRTALYRLMELDHSDAIAAIFELHQEDWLSRDETVDLLYSIQDQALAFLKKLGSQPHAAELAALLRRYSPDRGLPTVRPGIWVQTNAGYGIIQWIEDPRTRMTVDEFLEGEGEYTLHTTLQHTGFTEFLEEQVIIEMKNKMIRFPNARRIFVCSECDEFASTRLDTYKAHFNRMHPGRIICPPSNEKSIPLRQLIFHHKRS